jgi:hypothetical protein
LNREEIAVMRLRGKILAEVNRLYGEDVRRYCRENLKINGGEKVGNVTAI